MKVQGEDLYWRSLETFKIRRLLAWVICDGVRDRRWVGRVWCPVPRHASVESGSFGPWGCRWYKYFLCLKFTLNALSHFSSPAAFTVWPPEPRSQLQKCRGRRLSPQSVLPCPPGRWLTAQGVSAEWMNEFAQMFLHSLEYLIWFSSYSFSDFQTLQLLLKLHAWYKQPVSRSCYYHESANRWEPFIAVEARVHLLHIRRDSIFIPLQNGQRTVPWRSKEPWDKKLPREIDGWSSLGERRFWDRLDGRSATVGLL